MNEQTNLLASSSTKAWHSGLFDCFTNCGDSIEGCLLPWCHVSYLTANVVETMAGDGNFMNNITNDHRHDVNNNSNNNNKLNSSSAGGGKNQAPSFPFALCCRSVFCYPCMSYTLRLATVAAFSLPVNVEAPSCEFFCKACCLCPLSNMQVSRELISRGRHGGSCVIPPSRSGNVASMK